MIHRRPFAPASRRTDFSLRVNAAESPKARSPGRGTSSEGHMSTSYEAVRPGKKVLGRGSPGYIIAEIEINHNGDLDTAKRLISVAVAAGCDAVKFQRRTIEVVYSQEELARPRESPFGATNGDLKYGLEFEEEEFDELDIYCKAVNIPWFASCWDEHAVDVIAKYDVPCFKIASASLTDDSLLRHTRAIGKPIILSTGMSPVPLAQALRSFCWHAPRAMASVSSTRPAWARWASACQAPLLYRWHAVEARPSASMAMEASSSISRSLRRCAALGCLPSFSCSITMVTRRSGRRNRTTSARQASAATRTQGSRCPRLRNLPALTALPSGGS